MLRFDEKNFVVDTLGVTPYHSFSLFHHDERIALVGIWGIDNERIALNINYLKGQKFYSGYVIKRENLDAVLDLKGQ